MDHCRIQLLLVLLACTFGSVVNGQTLDRVQFGTCELDQDPLNNREELWAMACAKGKVGVERVFATGNPDLNASVRHGDGYLGLHLHRFVSVHGAGSWFHYIPDDKEVEQTEDERADLLIGQIGNPAFHKMRLQGGRLPLPFGVNYEETPVSYDTFISRQFWVEPEQGAVLQYDNLRDLVAEVGVSSNERRRKTDEETDEKEKIVRSASTRWMFDVPALDGSRLAFSGFWQETGARKFGFGFVTVSKKKDITSFEFVRHMPKPTLRAAPASQIFRLNYVSAWRDSARWVVQYDDAWRVRRSFIINRDIEIFRHCTGRFGLSYRRDFFGIEEEKQWYFSSGVEVSL